MAGSDSITIRSLAAQAGRKVEDVLLDLQTAGLAVAKGGQRLDGETLRQARMVLDLPEPRREAGPPREALRLDDSRMTVQILRPLLTKGKLGPTHTTPIEHLYGHGVPDHQKAQARDMTERFIRDGLLDEKVSQGRRHVWLTNTGRAALEEAERAHMQTA